MLTSALAVFGPIAVCCVAVYLHWQLADANLGAVAAEAFTSHALTSHALTSHALGAHAARPQPRRVPVGVAARVQREGRGEHALPRAPGIYIADPRAPESAHADATIRGQLLADRVVNGRFQSRTAPRRGTKGALDVIVVGANAVGISATLHLMRAGLRVLLIDRDEPAALDGTRRHAPRAARLPLLTGHEICDVAERADGMLEIQAERAAWYTANVIFAAPRYGAASASRAA